MRFDPVTKFNVNILFTLITLHVCDVGKNILG